MTQRFLYDQYAPKAMQALAQVYQYLQKSDLGLELLELVFLRTSQINNCAFCLNMHTTELLKNGMRIEKVTLLQAWSEAGTLFSPREQAALAWAESLTLVAKTGVPNDVYEQLKLHFDEQEITDLSIAISLMNCYNRLAISSRKSPSCLSTS